VGLGHAQIGQQERHRLGCHRRAVVGVDGQSVV
jgi:heat shock protein HspQ